MPRKKYGTRSPETWSAADANDLAARMTARALADVVTQANARARSYESLDTPAGNAAAEALRKFADSIAK